MKKLNLKKFLFIVAAVLIGLLSVGLMLEVLLRITKYSTPSLGRVDYFTGWRLGEGAYYYHTKEGKSKGYINSHGLRDYEFSYEKPDNTYRILVFGDSYTEALQVDLDSCFVKILERKLNESPPDATIKYEVLNMGVSGYGTANSYFLYTSEGVKYDPDLVILAFLTGNDIRDNSRKLDGSMNSPYFYINSQDSLAEDLSFRETIGAKLAGWEKILRSLKHKVYLISFIIERKELLFTQRKGDVATMQKKGDLLVSRDWTIYLKDLPREWEKAYEISKRAVLKFKDKVKSDGSDFLLMTLTNSSQISDKLIPNLNKALGSGNYDLEKPDREIRLFASQNGIDLFQLLPSFKESYLKTGTYYHGFEDNSGEGYDGHWNYKGHRLAGELLHRFLTRYITRNDRLGNRGQVSSTQKSVDVLID